MSSNATDARVKDEEGDVDRQTKQHLINLRKKVDEHELALYVEGRSDPKKNLSIVECNEYWKTVVRQYLRSIKRLWTGERKGDVQNAQHYWKEHQIGSVKLVPPDRHGYSFTQVSQMQLSDKKKRRLLGLPRGVKVPEPVSVDFNGLSSVVDKDRVEQAWSVCIDNTGPPLEHTNLQLQQSMPLPKHILENAVEAADVFLQQAGIGFEIGAPDYMGGEGPGI